MVREGGLDRRLFLIKERVQAAVYYFLNSSIMVDLVIVSPTDRLNEAFLSNFSFQG